MVGGRIKNVLFVFFAIFSLIIILHNTSWAAPHIIFLEKEHDCGKILQGKAATYTFEFKNTGDVPLEIKSVKAG